MGSTLLVCTSETTMVTEPSVRQAAKWLVVIWHLWVLGALLLALNVMRPLQGVFNKPSLWRPRNGWIRTGGFFQFPPGSAAALLLLVAAAVGILVFTIFFFDGRLRGWVGLVVWDGVGAYHL